MSESGPPASRRASPDAESPETAALPAAGDPGPEVLIRRTGAPQRPAADPPSQTPPQFTVLHIVRNMGGGVATAIMDYAAAVPEASHIVLCDQETSFELADAFPFTVLHRMPPSVRGAISAIRDTVSELEPDIIHAHSSFAGLYVRAGLSRKLLKRVIYSPHCFAFFRRDVSPPVRAAFWMAEAALTLRAPDIISCSPDEERAARRLLRSRTTYAPNVANVPPEIRLTVSDVVPRTKQHLIVTVGRMCPQKDPHLFLEAAVAARAENLDYDWLWIGGGDEETEALFRQQDVPFTGWVPRTSALAVLAQADIYLHTAAWEGAPISVLEAAALKIPVLGRHVPALASLGLRPLWHSTGELTGMLREGMSGAAISEARAQTADLLNGHTAQAQRSALLSAYGSVRSRRRSARTRTAQ